MEYTIRQKLVRFASSIAPGIFIIGYTIGTGSVTTMVVSGAKYGMSMTWALVLSCVFTYIMLVALSRYTAVTGKTLLFGFKERFGIWPVLFIMAVLIITEFTSIIGVMAIVTDVVREWSRPLTADNSGFPAIYSALFFTVILLYLIWSGRHGLFLKALSVMVALMGISFLMTMCMVTSEPAELLKGLVPSVPADGNASLIIAGLVGTTMAAVVLITRSYLVAEKGWKAADLRIANRDALISAILLIILNAAIIASAAGTMFVRGIQVENAIDMVNTLEPLAGRFAVSIFVVGIVAAGLSSLFPNYIIATWLISDYLNIPRDLTRPYFRAIILFMAAMGFVVPVFGGKPVILMIASQAVSPVVMPLMIVFLIILLNSRIDMGKYKNGFWLNAGLVTTLLFSLYMFGTAIIGLSGFFGW